MNKRIVFPFAAIVGQEDIKQALLIAIVNPKAGGVLVAGEKGTAKSSLVRALAEVMSNKKIIELPLNATEDMVFGNVDLECAVTSGKKIFSPGILARAHGQVLYVDEINLLRQEVLTSILDTADRGINIVEREGISHQHEAEFALIGTMNPEEGTLSSAALDRFGLFAAVERETNLSNRTEILRRVLDYEKNPVLFCQQYEGATQELRKKLESAKVMIASVEISVAMIELAAQYCAKAHSEGHRAELFLLETAKAIAVLAERCYLLPADIERAAFFVLPHRMHQQETPPPEEEQDDSTENENNQTEQDNQTEQEDQSDSSTDNEPPDIQEEEEKTEDSSENNKDDLPPQQDNVADRERIADIDTSFSNAKLSLSLPQDRQVRKGSGKRSLTRTDLKQGRYVRSCLPKGKLTDLAFDATLRAAAPYQRLRTSENCYIVIRQEDLRQKVREKRIGNTFLFAVDASGSMGARERMAAVKGAIFSMLQDAYQKRDQVGLIAFRRKTAEVLLPITRSIDLAQKCLKQLPTGGKTPLAEGLATAFSVLQSMKKKEREMQPVLVLVTDGRANSSKEGGDPIAEAVKMADKIKTAGFHSVVIDTETDFIKLGGAKKIAREMGSSYYGLQELSEQKILHIVNNL